MTSPAQAAPCLAPGQHALGPRTRHAVARVVHGLDPRPAVLLGPARAGLHAAAILKDQIGACGGRVGRGEGACVRARVGGCGRAVRAAELSCGGGAPGNHCGLARSPRPARAPPSVRGRPAPRCVWPHPGRARRSRCPLAGARARSRKRWHGPEGARARGGWGEGGARARSARWPPHASAPPRASRKVVTMTTSRPRAAPPVPCAQQPRGDP